MLDSQLEFRLVTRLGKSVHNFCPRKRLLPTFPGARLNFLPYWLERLPFFLKIIILTVWIQTNASFEYDHALFTSHDLSFHDQVSQIPQNILCLLSQLNNHDSWSSSMSTNLDLLLQFPLISNKRLCLKCKHSLLHCKIKDKSNIKQELAQVAQDGRLRLKFGSLSSKYSQRYIIS